MSGTYSITVQEARGLVAVSADIDRLAVVMGCSSSGSELSPFYGSGTAAVTGRGYGDSVDTLAQIIEQKQESGNGVKIPAAHYALPVVTNGSYGAVDSSGKDGTSAVTVDSAVHPYGTYDAYIRVVTGGNIGTTGITFVWSLDAGRTESKITALGTAVSYTIATGNVKFAFGTGSLVAGDIVRVPTVAPAPDSAGITAAFNDLAAGSIQFGVLVCDFEMTAAFAAVVTAGKATLIAAGKRALILARTRTPDFATAESESAWLLDTASDYSAVNDSCIGLVAAFGLVTDAMTGRRYLRSLLQQFAADVVRVGISDWPDCPADQRMANVSLVDSSGLLLGHDEGPRGGATGLSNDTLGNRFISVQRLPDASRLEDVYTTAPWVLYAADERIRNIMTRRVANAIERVAVTAATTQMGAKVRYTPAVGSTPARLTEGSRRALHGVIFDAISKTFKNHIQNSTAAALDSGLVQVNQDITVSAGNLASVSVTIAPLVFGYLLNLDITLAVQA
jgi:hypothetical protein